MKIKKLARKLQAEISEDPALAKPSYCWCREQVVAPASVAFTDWAAFVVEVKTRARKAG
ncbi:MAG TPA: hypothetical protein VK571_04895 [Gemmatimonadaceae bacterium]|nr:hypothetical protein [Gemmatimonadaceae bacterium]